MIPFLILIICLPLYGGQSMETTTDTITFTSPVRDPNAIVSRGQKYKLGFYTPENTTDRYMSILWSFSDKPVFWVANRDKPLRDTSGVIAISEEGNLVLVNGENEVVWSTNITKKRNRGYGYRNPMNTTAQILDSGNLVLRDNSTGEVIWDSFSHPTNVWMTTMPLVDDTNTVPNVIKNETQSDHCCTNICLGTGSKVMLTSWKNESDPSIGSFRLGLQAQGIPQLFIWHSDGRPHYRTGQWNGQIFIGSRILYTTSYARGLKINETAPGVFHITATIADYLIIYLDPLGTKSIMVWNDNNGTWDGFGFTPEYECDIYGKCGAFGVCDIRNPRKICSCMRGFEPVDRREWDRGNWTSGCVRKAQLQCKNDNKGKEDGFLRLRNMKVPDYAERFASSNEEECRSRCLENCSCIAYAHDAFNIGCMFWKEGDEGLIDTQQFEKFGVDLYVRLAASEFDVYNRDRRTLIAVVSVSGITFSILVLIFIWRCWMLMKRGEETKERDVSDANVTISSDSTAIFLQEKSKGPDFIEELPLFAFDTLAVATNQFSWANFLGKGGFGHVYKGKLKNGEHVAVKRLSEASSQGIEEFLNEVFVISKLQHRNLVNLMGCCVEKGEKILIYEYMTNKSLDICLFNHSHPSRKILDWEKRLNIIKGIGRGLLYLHRDSILRIIHRDLKASNVLLDQDWNPKISDFGMARIFAANQDQANTMRVVGTYGYMAPEYATEGVFSEKSDVYSFGVLMLEIISGKRNSHFYDHDVCLSILGCAWKFMNEDDNGDAFIDQDILLNSDSRDEIVRCVHIALLCVQEFAKGRPMVQTVLSMLDGEIADLPMPEQPVLSEKWNSTAQSTTQIDHSINEMTVTELHGR